MHKILEISVDLEIKTFSFYLSSDLSTRAASFARYDNYHWRVQLNTLLHVIRRDVSIFANAKIFTPLSNSPPISVALCRVRCNDMCVHTTRNRREREKDEEEKGGRLKCIVREDSVMWE